jgi:5-methylcytosine-specific restriction endonuclease McrA
MARAVASWIGKTDDTPIPPRVKLRVFESAKGICHICQRVIQAGERWDAEHVIAIINGGANAEVNLLPAHKACHPTKTAADLKEKSKVAAVRKKHIGITRPVQKIKSAPFPQSAKSARRAEKPSLPPRQLFKPVEDRP